MTWNRWDRMNAPSEDDYSEESDADSVVVDWDEADWAVVAWDLGAIDPDNPFAA